MDSGFDAALDAEAEGPPDDSLWPAWGQTKEGGAPRHGKDFGLSGEAATEGALNAAGVDTPLQIAGPPLSPDQATAAAAAIVSLAAISQDARASSMGLPDTSGVTGVMGLAQPGAQPVSPDGQLPAPETALLSERASPAERTAGPQTSALSRVESAVPLPPGYDLSAADQLMLTGELAREPLAKPLQSGAVEGAIRFALATSDTPPAQLSLPPPTAAAEVTATDPRRRQVEQTPPPEDWALALEDTGPRTPRPSSDAIASRPALTGPMPQDPTILAAADESALQDLSAIGDSEALPSLSDTQRSHARVSMPGSAVSLPTSLPSTILGVVLAPVPGGVEVALSPAELGQLRIEVTPDGDTLRIVLSAERPETLDLLRRNADQLMVEVLQAGFSGAAMSFGTWGGQTGGEGTSASPNTSSESDARPDIAAAFTQLPHLPAHDGGLNLRL